MSFGAWDWTSSRRTVTKAKATSHDVVADAIMQPTKPYTDMTFDMGKDPLPRHLHDPVLGRLDVLQVAHSAKTGPLLPPAHGS